MSDALYQKVILELAAEGAKPSLLEQPHGSARIDNPLCGDRVDAQVRVRGDVIEAVGFKVRGCRLCEASAALVRRAAPGMQTGAWLALAGEFEAMVRRDTPAPGGLPEARAFAPVHDYKSRHDCPLLPFQALEAALTDAGPG